MRKPRYIFFPSPSNDRREIFVWCYYELHAVTSCRYELEPAATFLYLSSMLSQMKNVLSAVLGNILVRKPRVNPRFNWHWQNDNKNSKLNMPYSKKNTHMKIDETHSCCILL